MTSPGPGEPDFTPPPIPQYDPDAQRRAANPDAELRAKALERIEEKRAFLAHLGSYWGVMTLLVVIWLLTSGWNSYFWPIWPMLGWGIGVASHGLSLRQESEPSEEQIAKEAAKLRAREQRRLED